MVLINVDERCFQPKADGFFVFFVFEVDLTSETMSRPRAGCIERSIKTSGASNVCLCIEVWNSTDR